METLDFGAKNKNARKFLKRIALFAFVCVILLWIGAFLSGSPVGKSLLPTGSLSKIARSPELDQPHEQNILIPNQNK